MDDLVRILLVEDSEDDALLISKQLDREGVKNYCRRVESAEVFKKALGEDQWDVVVSDYSMPSFTGLDALNILKATGLDVPFIIVSGMIGEDTAVEVMRAGAHDYLMKDNLARLLPAVQREIEEAKIRKERRLVEEELRKSEQRFKNMFENLSDGVLVVDVKTEAVVQFNAAFCKMTGYSEGELLKMTLEDVHPPESLGIIRKKIQGQSLGDTAFVPDIPVVRKDGGVFLAEVSATLTEVNGGVCVLGVFRDMTEQRVAEQELKAKMKEIKKQYDIMLGREKRVLEVKAEVNDLLAELGRKKKYLL
jgi:PAS domain S-box-containing protein